MNLNKYKLFLLSVRRKLQYSIIVRFKIQNAESIVSILPRKWDPSVTGSFFCVCSACFTGTLTPRRDMGT